MMKAPSSHDLIYPNYPLKASLPNTNTLEVRLSMYEFGGNINIQSIA